MRWLIRGVITVVLLGVAVGGTIMGASEMGGEIVTLRTRDAGGEWVETRLWVVEDDGSAWLRAGGPTSGWFVRLEAEPAIEVERGGTTATYTAVPVRDPVRRDRTHALMAEHYGLADRIIGLIRDGDQSIAVRLDPAT